MRYSNCWIWARWQYGVRVRQWRRNGCIPGEAPYWVKRPSQMEPHELPHYMLGTYSPALDALVLESFKPDAPTSVPLRKAWKHFLFVGRVRRGDFPDTKQTEGPT